MTLLAIATHPVQYHAPLYQALQSRFGVPVTVVYGSDFSVRGSLDREFGREVRWDTDLLSGYTSCFLGHENGLPRTLPVRKLKRLLATFNPKAILLSGYAGGFHARAIATATISSTPLIFRAETTDHAIVRSRGQSFVRDAALRALYARCNVLCPIGTRSRDHYERLGVSKRKLVDVPYCVNTSPFELDPAQATEMRQRVRKELGIADDARVLLFSGKLSQRKGVDDLLKAVGSIVGVHLVFMGSGERQPELQLAASGSLAPRIHFVGFKNQSEMSPYFHAADVLVLPSRSSETWGLVVNEALHHGLCVVASNAVGCVPDLVIPGRTGEVFAAGDVRSLAAALRKVLAWSGEPGVRERCREQVQAYSLDAAATGLHAAYQLAVG